MKSSNRPIITAEWCPHPLEKGKILIRGRVKVPPSDQDETVILLLDESGSMDSVMKDMREKTKLWIETLQKKKSPASHHFSRV